MHASAVAFDDRVVAFSASSGTGKTSTALHMLARGARFVTDDVLAVSVGEDGILAHPARASSALRASDLAGLNHGGQAGLGRVLGGYHKLQVQVRARRPPAAPRRAVRARARERRADARGRPLKTMPPTSCWRPRSFRTSRHRATCSGISTRARGCPPTVETFHVRVAGRHGRRAGRGRAPSALDRGRAVEGGSATRPGRSEDADRTAPPAKKRGRSSDIVALDSGAPVRRAGAAGDSPGPARRPDQRRRHLGTRPPRRAAAPARDPGQAVLEPPPLDSSARHQSLFLTAMLARRGIDSNVVIGVRSDPEFAAHAWVERNGVALLPPGDYGRVVALPPTTGRHSPASTTSARPWATTRREPP